MSTGTRRHEVYLMNDVVRPWTTSAGKDLKMEHEPVVGDRELSFKYEISRLEDGALNDLSAQKILGSLGFRPPHASFFLLFYHDLMRLRAFAHPRAFRDFDVFGRHVNAASRNPDFHQNLMGASLGEAEVEVAICEITNNFIRFRRTKLHSSGFTVFSGIFNLMEKKPP